jgi:lipopolysaccharide transport system ATP-binding protein
VRLAFAVAAHLEPEILLVDEVLAVGDINFQKKCLGKMGDVARAGRTVVLVSHQMNQIRRLCHRVVWVDEGSIRLNGNSHEVVSAYESAMASGDRQPQKAGNGVREPTTKARFTRWEIAEPRGESPYVLNKLGPVTVRFLVEVREPIEAVYHGIALYSHDRQLMWGWATREEFRLEIGEHEFCYSFPMLPLRPGPYYWLVSLYDGGQEVDTVDFVPEMIVTTENHQHHWDQWNGVLNIPSEFTMHLLRD